jgi:hypothetical protein
MKSSYQNVVGKFEMKKLVGDYSRASEGIPDQFRAFSRILFSRDPFNIIPYTLTSP